MADEMEQYRDDIKKKAEQLIKVGLPAKVIEINNLVTELRSKNKNLSLVSEDLNIPITSDSDDDSSLLSVDDLTLEETNKVYKRGKKVVQSNKQISEFTETVKSYCIQLVEDANLLKTWIAFMIPKVEDGNNFGVEIQTMILDMVSTAEYHAFEYKETILDYYLSRGGILARAIKFPQIEDMRMAVRHTDEKVYLALWWTLYEIRNRYSIMHYEITKNYDKIMRPRNNNVETLY